MVEPVSPPGAVAAAAPPMCFTITKSSLPFCISISSAKCGKVPWAVAGLRLHGFSAPMVMDGPMTRPWFLAYLEQVLAPTLTES
jgi:hypothetical protein